MAVEIVGLRLAWTTTLSVAVPVPPLPSDTVTTTEYVAAVANACVGFWLAPATLTVTLAV